MNIGNLYEAILNIFIQCYICMYVCMYVGECWHECIYVCGHGLCIQYVPLYRTIQDQIKCVMHHFIHVLTKWLFHLKELYSPSS